MHMSEAMENKLTYSQSYSLLTMLACRGNVERVVEHVKNKMPEYAKESERFLNLYEAHRRKKLFKNIDGYVDPEAAKKAWMAYAANKAGGG